MLTSFNASLRWLRGSRVTQTAIAVIISSTLVSGVHPGTPPASAAIHSSEATQVQAEQTDAEGDQTTAVLKPKAIETVQVTATGYTAGVESTGKQPGEHGYGITYSGVKVRRDHVSTIAADPDVFPIGTLLYIPGYGYGVVADTGSAIKGRRIDLYFETTKQVYKQWGKRTVQVEVLKKGDGKLKEAWLSALNKAVSASKTIPTDYIES